MGHGWSWGYHIFGQTPFWMPWLCFIVLCYTNLPAQTICESFSSAIKCYNHSCQNFRHTQNPQSKMSTRVLTHPPNQENEIDLK